MMALHYHLVTLAALLLTVQIILDNVLVEGANTNFSFSYFNTSDSFLMIDDVKFNVDNSSFTMNSMNAEGPGTTNTTTSPCRCGRLLYKDKVRMKDSASGAVASFHTAFTFQITGPNYWISGISGRFIHGDGLAFTFVRSLTTVGEDAGGSLCLLNASNNGMASNRLFAVEFDTFRNLVWNDSSDSHIGVNLNSLNSTWSHNLCHSGTNARNCSYLCNGGYFTAWIDYDSTLQKLQVFFDNGSLFKNIPKPPKPLIEANLSLPDLLDDYIYVGFSSSTGGASEVHQIQSWRFTSSGLPDVIMVPTNPASNSSHWSKIKVLIILAAAGVSIGVVLALLVALRARFGRKLSFRKQDRSVSLVDQNLVPRMFTNKELSKATKDFSRSKFLGSGGFGAVYQGSLPSGAVVAVKRMRMESKQGKECFQAEVASLSNIRHRNLVQLRGWCHEKDQLLLVYDYMCNGSLDKWLFPSSNLNEDKALPLQLNLRHSVLSGVAAALAYLHEECEKCVLHRDIKSSNVLLDGDWNAYLGDFGLARLIDHQKLEKTTAMAGTFGYMAPEMPHTWKATKESDVYSFGVLMLEVMCGRRALEMCAIERGEGLLVDRVWRAHEAGSILEVADSRMEAIFPPSDIERSSISSKGSEMQEASVLVTADVVDPNSGIIPAPDGIVEEERIRSLLQLGLLCCNPNPENRPSMRLVSQLLQSSKNMEMSLPPLPGCKPQVHYLD